MQLPFAIAAVLALSAALTTHVRAAERQAGGNLALCVGIDGYEHLEPLASAVNDAANLGRAFESTGDFRRVIVLADLDAAGRPNQPRFIPARKNILDMLRLLANNAMAEDALFFFFAGHGMLADGKAYLMPMEADPGEADRPEAGIALDDVAAIMAKTRAGRKVILLDACRDSEAFPGLGGPIEAPGNGFTVIVSCGGDQSSLIDSSTGRGVFGLALAAALSGDADTDFDGAYTGGELYTFLDKFLGDYCLENLLVAGQNPQMRQGGADTVLLRGYATAKPIAIAPAKEEPPPPAETPATQEDGPAAQSVAATPSAPPVVDAALLPIPPGEPAPEPTAGASAAETSGPDALRERLDSARRLREAGKAEEAFRELYELARLGAPAEAAYLVGDSYYFGKGAEQSYEKAIEWFTRAGGQGHAKAQEMLVMMYFWGKGAPPDSEMASKWSKLRDAGPAPAAQPAPTVVEPPPPAPAASAPAPQPHQGSRLYK